jgi:hypothetical protein
MSALTDALGEPAIDVVAKGNAATVHGGAQAEDRPRGRCVQDAGRGRGAVAGAAVLVPPDDIGLLTPADVYHRLAQRGVVARATVLATAYATHPERVPAGLPLPLPRPVDVWINPPKARAT